MRQHDANGTFDSVRTYSIKIDHGPRSQFTSRGAAQANDEYDDPAAQLTELAKSFQAQNPTLTFAAALNACQLTRQGADLMRQYNAGAGAPDRRPRQEIREAERIRLRDSRLASDMLHKKASALLQAGAVKNYSAGVHRALRDDGELARAYATEVAGRQGVSYGE
jgi:hypothetical protein